MKKFILFLLLPLYLFSYQIEIKEWGKGNSFFGFLRENKIPVNLYYSLDKKTRKMVANLSKDSIVYFIRDNNNIKQVLISLNDKKQLSIARYGKKYKAKVIDIFYETRKNYVEFNVNNFLSYDVYRNTRNPYLSAKIASIFSDRINFKYLPKGSFIKVYYQDKIRFGKIRDTKVLYASVSNRFYNYEAFLNPKDNRYYDRYAKSLKGMFLKAPLKYSRISSPFGMRYHPILHRMRMHDGIDFVNRVGTPIKSVADGRIIWKGWLGGYGRAVKIQHKNGYMTLYGHLKGYGRIRKGQYVKQGQIIGYLGNTGLSTGPHLHFGVMKNHRWINPKKLKNSVKVTLNGRDKRLFLSSVKKIKREISSNLAMK